MQILFAKHLRAAIERVMKNKTQAKREWFFVYSTFLLLSIAPNIFKVTETKSRCKKEMLLVFYRIQLLFSKKNWHVFEGCLYYIQISIFIDAWHVGLSSISRSFLLLLSFDDHTPLLLKQKQQQCNDGIAANKTKRNEKRKKSWKYSCT